MSELKDPSPGIFFFSILYRTDKVFLNDLYQISRDHLGEIIMLKDPYFPMQQYYQKEMGSPLERLFFIGTQKRKREDLVTLKLKACQWEQEVAIEGRRILNVDPGLITLENLLLATGKPYAHRIYLSQGVFADLTLIQKDGEFKALEWTYPDYKSDSLREHFGWIRKRYLLSN